MKAKFEIKAWLGSKREEIISNYNKLTTEENFNGISLKEFMLKILSLMEINNPKSEKRAESLLPLLMGDVYVNNSKIVAEDKVTNALRAKYEGTAYMAMV